MKLFRVAGWLVGCNTLRLKPAPALLSLATFKKYCFPNTISITFQSIPPILRQSSITL